MTNSPRRIALSDCLLVLDDHGRSVLIDAEGVHASAGFGAGREFGGEKGDPEKSVEVLLEEALEGFLQRH